VSYRVRIAACALLTAVTGCTVEAPVESVAPPDAQPSTSAALTEDQLRGHWGADLKTASDLNVPWLQFDPGGRAEGYNGCNWVIGTWELGPDSNTVQLDARLTTSAACPTIEEPRFDVLTFDGAKLNYKLRSGTTKSLQRNPAAS